MQTIFSKKFWLLCIAVGIFLLGIVFALSRQADMQNCEQRLAGAIEFIKEQAADYTKYNETAIAKGLVRETAAVHTLESLSLDCDEAALSERAKELWLTGICLLDAQGALARARSALDLPDLVLAANELRAAAEAIGRVLGKVYSDDLLDALFSRFCVGK